MIKFLLNKILSLFDYEVQQINQEVPKMYQIRTSTKDSYTLIKELGFNPNVIIDVGVATGTEELTSVFKDNFYLLVEPLKEFEEDMKKMLEEHNGEYVLCAAGSSDTEITFNVHGDHLSGSSIYKENMDTDIENEITVPMYKLDTIIKQKNLNGPFLLKIDVQGAELDVLDGAKSILNDTEVVVLEISLFEFMKDAPIFYDVVKYMKKLDFVVYDIIQGWNRPLDNALGQVDIMFVKENGRFRQSHSYEQKGIK